MTQVNARLAHLGLGAFHRAHQAWYTHRANLDQSGDPWLITAFTGRQVELARILSDQDGRYTLIERAADGDHATMIETHAAALPGGDHESWRSVLADDQISVLTTTVTEAAYLIDDQDRQRLAAGEAGISVPARIVDGLRGRHRSGGAPIAVLCCDNLTDNGTMLRGRVLELAGDLGADFADWVAGSVTFPSSMVDRITPATTADDLVVAKELSGWDDRAPVITEPFSEWVIAGDFPAGRPAWDVAGVRFVADVQPYEQRKLWLLNGAHSLLAYLGLQRGLSTIAETMADPVCVAAMEDAWRDAAAVLPFKQAEIDAATAALRDRFGNPRIQHRLAQIAADGSQKFPVRFGDVYRHRRSAGLDHGAALPLAVAAWICHLQTDLVKDAGAVELITALAGAAGDADRVRLALAVLGPEAADDNHLARDTEARLTELHTTGETPS
ncbi:mannitol dehydrogenase family protein [Microlunatus speluncae]|uniref:mannitol dehydrogenase family protein n=1 Tax=Microlunatus speluncae TaxID=2594267 RepID=UPI0012666ED8|nr:mannitol dehydrogenase family protein [Microlunatus speluncae]